MAVSSGMTTFDSVSSHTYNFTSASLNGTRPLYEASQNYHHFLAHSDNQPKSRTSLHWQKYKVSETVDQRQARLERVKNSMARSRANETPDQRKARLERVRVHRSLFKKRHLETAKPKYPNKPAYDSIQVKRKKID